MNTDYTKPSLAPKPRFVCHASLKLPSPITSAARGPKPFIAPKPKITSLLNGNQGEFSNGSVITSDEEVDEDHERQNCQNRVIIDILPAEKQFVDSICKSPRKAIQTVSKKQLDREVKEEENDEEEDAIQKTDDDWRLTDSALTEETDSLETLWVSDSRLTADSVEVEEMIDTDVTEDMDAEGCDAGEALADTDGLSVGNISVNSTDEQERRYSADSCDAKQEKLQINEDGSTADDLSESLIDEPGLLVTDNMTDTEAKHAFLMEEKIEESGPDCGFSYNILKCSHKIKERGGKWQNICFYNLIPGSDEEVCDTTSKHAALEGHRVHEPLYICSEDIINQGMRLDSKLSKNSFYPINKSGLLGRKYEEREENGKIQDCLNVGEYGNNSGNKNREKICQKFPFIQNKEDKANEQEDMLNHLDCQLRFRQVPTDMDTSLTSSFSDSQLLSPNDSDVFRDEDDLEGHIVPFLDETTDTEQDISDEHVYEEPRQSSETKNVFPFDTKATGIRSHSLSHRITNNVEDMGVQFFQKTYVSGFGQPALSSSPMLSSTRHKSYSKPQYLSLYPRSLSMEGKDTHMCVYRDGSQRHRDAVYSSESFSRGSPLSSSALSTPTSLVDIPPPFELAYITKKPITKSSPSLLTGGDSSEKNKKKKSSLKRFLMLKFGWKTENKPVDVKSSSSKTSAGYSHRMPSRLLDLDRHSISSSPRLSSRSASRPQVSPEPASTFLFYEESKRKGNSVAFLNRSVVRVESFEDRSRVPFIPLPLTKPRSISFPNTDTSDYENVPAISSDYENVQVPQRRPVRQVPRKDFFDRSGRVLSAANETDGYVDMSSLPGFEKITQSPEQETESAYTEAYNVCSVAIGPQSASVGNGHGEKVAEEDQGRISEEEDGGIDNNYDRLPDGRSRAFYIVKELVDTERLHVKALKLLQEDFREAVGSAVGDEGQPVLDDERLREILNELPDVYSLHRKILNELENRIRHWEESQKIADIFLCRKAEFLVFTTYIGHYNRSMTLLEDSCRTSPSFASIVQKFEEHSPAGKKASLKHQLLQVIVRVAQYRMLLTDYLNNLSPDSKEYEDTQAAVAIVSDIADQVNDSIKHGENLLRLINIAYSVRGQQDLLHPDRVFVKEGNLMKVSRKSHQPRHLFLMNDMLLYTYPQQDGKYRLKNTLPLTELKVSKPIIENVQNALKIEATDISIILSASSFLEREDWFYTLNRAVTEHTRGSAAFNSCLGEARDCLRLSLGEKAPTLVPVSQVMMCMNCTTDFSLTLRRHHCHGCGRIVCRSCSRNRYPLKYMKGRMAKVCDHCYGELKKRGKDSPRVNRSSRPLSTVFQNIHPPNIWRHRKGTATFTQVTVSEEGSISGSLQRSKKSKRNWKRLWFLLKDKVLYTYRAQEEKVASESLPLLGFTVKLPDRQGGDDEDNVFQLYHKNTLYYSFKAEDNFTAQRWVNAMEEATNL
ncbi:FYVE, RhoGEF and PH domain-containing protein 5-like isoform X2 [Melanotaenia boesemani]|uniref:FYVE, RhoGEF and PH domain-containing protein 5-like isoform X2 n=1 Tax=Melanotaenia boesemani TaxID=1250792 RepID=UPI001C04E973|nr:FYVE, RhoGEF and PH domain-containing protein 5-like isoform X2 [Melanotaenia boesemani]